MSAQRDDESLPPAAVDNLLEAATAHDSSGLLFDGLAIHQDDGGTYSLETPDSSHEDLSRTDLEAALYEVPALVTNWHFWELVVAGQGTPRRAFLRWCEGASLEPESDDESDAGTGPDPDDDHGTPVAERYRALETGVTRHWGELELTARLAPDVEGHGQGRRVYDVRHVEDADVPAHELEGHDHPHEAREIVTTDEKDRYRPLKTAPTLVTGWHFEGLSGDDFVETVRTIYPATIANWYREQRGELDVDHWLETAERQTGIYDIVDELPREAVEWVAEACCVDSQCVKRREWQYEDGDELAVDGGDGVFPCREPCSLVTAAARRWTVLESEDEKTWHLELTTSEMNQLVEIVDAVAEGRTDEIREADVYDGANRYRARYLRAKRMGDGSLGHEVEGDAGHDDHDSESGHDDHDSESDHDGHDSERDHDSDDDH